MTDVPKIVSEYEAAALVAMSPDLLRWLTRYAPKANIKTKLKIAKKDGERVFYDREELLAFDAFLRQPWPKKDKYRPHIPSKILDEIKIEANGECAMCCQHGNKCEAAHLEPMASSQSNHPENLLWLCANHHTSYDKGHYGPRTEDMDFVRNYKKILRRFRVMQWQMQAQLSLKLISALESCALLSKQLNEAVTGGQIAAVEAVATKFLSDLPSMAPVSKTDKRFHEFEHISLEVESLSSSDAPVQERLGRAVLLRVKYVAAMEMATCPLCHATGVHGGADCPVCDGNKVVTPEEVCGVDLSRFDYIDCPLCSGTGSYEGETCPACGGEHKMERRQAEWIDVRDYANITCPICEGSGMHFSASCLACDGEGAMEQRHVDRLDLRQYDIVDCPLCKGLGRNGGDDCPECRGERQMLRLDADNVDTRDYDLSSCPVCDGSRRLHGDDCPACEAEGKVERRYIDRIDKREYMQVDCPVCKNNVVQRYECRACGGEGEMQRRHADQIDSRDYR